MNRPVREEQHGTVTGYRYGCRCLECRRAERAEIFVSDAVLDDVRRAIEHESDLDGLCTATTARLGEIAGISQHHASNALRRLRKEGRVRIDGRVGRGGAFEIYLLDA